MGGQRAGTKITFHSLLAKCRTPEARAREQKFIDERLKPYMARTHCSVEKALKHVEEVRKRIREIEMEPELTDEEYEAYLEDLEEDKEGS